MIAFIAAFVLSLLGLKDDEDKKFARVTTFGSVLAVLVYAASCC